MYYVNTDYYDPYRNYGYSMEEAFFSCNLCHDNKNINCLECGEIDVQSCMDNLHNNSIDDGNIYILFNEIPKGDSRICKTT